MKKCRVLYGVAFQTVSGLSWPIQVLLLKILLTLTGFVVVVLPSQVFPIYI